MEQLIGNEALIYPILGGILIGLAAIGMMLFNGRIAGISGILKGALRYEKNDFLWRAAFLAGMILAGLAISRLYPGYAEIEISRSIWAYGVSGLLVGIGAGLSNGCTSGHGVCGVGRLSNRSVMITMMFTMAGIVTVWVINTLLGGDHMKTQAIAAFCCGALFAVGLALAGMTQPAKIIGFLDVFGNWDPSLVFVLASAVGVYYLTFQIVTRRSGPVIAPKFMIPTRNDVDLRSVSGALIFGIGWGISGLCPGPILTTLGTGTTSVLVLLVSMLIGLYVAPLIGRSR